MAQHTQALESELSFSIIQALPPSLPSGSARDCFFWSTLLSRESSCSNEVRRLSQRNAKENDSGGEMTLLFFFVGADRQKVRKVKIRTFFILHFCGRPH